MPAKHPNKRPARGPTLAEQRAQRERLALIERLAVGGAALVAVVAIIGGIGWLLSLLWQAQSAAPHHVSAADCTAGRGVGLTRIVVVDRTNPVAASVAETAKRDLEALETDTTRPITRVAVVEMPPRPDAAPASATPPPPAQAGAQGQPVPTRETPATAPTATEPPATLACLDRPMTERDQALSLEDESETRQRRTAALDRIEAALAGGAMQEEYPQSPIIETVDAAARAFASPDDGASTEVFVYSDMLQNTPARSLYRNGRRPGDIPPENFMPRLIGMEVHIKLILRDLDDVETICAYWDPILSNSGKARVIWSVASPEAYQPVDERASCESLAQQIKVRTAFLNERDKSR
jgi:hypothetical protein